MALTIDGKKYRVIENLGYQHGAGYVKIVSYDGGERTAVKRGGVWTWWTVSDRLSLPPTGPIMGQAVPSAAAPQPGETT